MVMVCDAWAVLPHASVAVQVRTNEPVLPHWPLIGPSLCVIETVPQVSPPVAMPVALGAVEPVHSTMASGTSLIVGAVVSTMVMVWVDWAVLPQASVAVHVRTNEPVLPHWPLIGPSLCVIETVPQVSLPVAVPVAPGAVEPAHSTMASGTSLIVGAVVSTMVMVWVDWAVLPQASVAVHVRMKLPVLPH